ncbi:MAG: type II secretion system secretin GspD [Acidiferrobacterales bacterium]
MATRPLRPGEMLFNFQDADIQAVIKTVSQITGRNFLLDPRVKGKVTIISSTPVSKAAAYQIFISALKAQGFTAINGPGGIVKIIPEAEAKSGATVSFGTSARNSDQWTTHVVIVQHASAPQLIPLLRPLMSPSAMLSVYVPANALIITDTASSVRNVLGVVDRLDQPGSTDITVIPLIHASVLDVAQVISHFAEGASVAGQPGQPVGLPGQFGGGDNRLVIVPDVRTNSLLVHAENPGRLLELRSLITKLDVPANSGGQTHVVYLRNAEASKLAEILRGLLSGEARAASASPSISGATAVAPSATGKVAEASQIQADEASNALIINAPDAVYNSLRSVIAKLDIRRAQVFIEALIAEVSSSRGSQFGIQWAGLTGAGSGGVAALTNFSAAPGIINTVADPTTTLGSANGLSIGFVGPKIVLPDGTVTRGLGALATALETDAKANILSSPNLLTLDNAEAKIVVAQNVPFLTGSFAQATTTTGTVNPFQTIERKDVGLTLKVKPQISEGGTVRLKISEEVSSVVPSADPLTESTNKRTLNTTVIVDDGNTVVLGGLIQDSVNNNVQAVPFLGRIPFLGALFRYRDVQKSKTNLMIFLRPVIVRSRSDASGFSTDRYDYIEGQQPSLTPAQQTLLNRFDPRKNVVPKVGPADRANNSENGALLGPPGIPADSPIDVDKHPAATPKQ